MNIQNYFIELLLGGIGAITWILLLSLDIFGLWIPINILFPVKETNIILAEIIVLTFPFLYISGIVTDRVSDLIFEWLFEAKLFKKHFSGKEEYLRLRSNLYKQSDRLINMYEYGRMRCRICRDWAFNSIIILIAGNIFIWFDRCAQLIPDDIPFQLKLSVFISFLLIASTVISWYTWYSLTKKEYMFLKIQEKKVQEDV